MIDFKEYKFFDDAYVRENELYEDIKDLWIRNGITISDMDERAKQVIVGVQYKGKVVGVVSRIVVSEENHPELKDKKLAYVREFIDVDHRNFKLHKRMFWIGIELLEHRGIVDGVLFNTENKKFERPGYTKRLKDNGFTVLSSVSDDVYWYKLF